MSWWRMNTLRSRLALWYALGGVVLLAAFSAVIYSYVAQRMARPLDHQLRADLMDVRTHLKLQEDGSIRWDGRPVAPDVAWPWESQWFEVWDDNGELVRRLWPLEDKQVEQLPYAPARGRETLSVFNVAPNLRLRVLSVPLGLPGRDGWMLRVMRIHEPVADAMGALLAIIGISLPIVVVLLVAGGYLVTRHWLRPLENMVRQAEAIKADNLGQRLTVAKSADELWRLGAAFNRTLDRLEDSFRTLDQFVADASHELRTPLTTLRNVGEVGLQRGRTAEEYREIIGSMLEEAQRLHQLVERLLELASAEGGARTVHRERIQLDQFIEACVGELGILAEYKNQQFALFAVPCLVMTDPVLLRQAFQNLADNAMKYSPLGATIRVDVEVVGADCRVTVTDEGPGIPPDQIDRLAERFYRVEDSRVRGRGGFGLGLAITKAYMHVLGGRLECSIAEPGGSRFSLILPGPEAR